MSDGEKVHFYCWADGYLVTDDGNVYKYNYDFGRLLTEYSYEEKQQFNVRDKSSYLDIPFYSMITAENQWHKELLREAEDDVPAEGLTLTLSDDSGDPGFLHGIIENHSKEDWKHWKYILTFDLLTELDGTWYHLPVRPESPRLIDSEEEYLKTGKSLVRTYEVGTVYGILPAGHYQIREGNGPWAEFTVDKEGKYIY